MSKQIKLTVISIVLMLPCILAFGQPLEYYNLIKKAETLNKAGQYKTSATTYSEAFETFGWKGTINDRYNAACSWALAFVPDSAFFQLFRIANKANYINYSHISTDPDLVILHEDQRWQELLDIIKQNKIKAEKNINKPLAAQLDSIYNDDQRYRLEIDEIQNKHGRESAEMQAHLKLLMVKDSINIIRVSAILDQYGWLGSDIVGVQGNRALFLVVQHADISVQEKYLPMMREAVKNGKALGSSLALLEDRVALRQGRKQIYGSQVAIDEESGSHYILPLEDPENVDIRRANVGLQPLADYVSNWQIKWDIDQYIKDLPAIEAKEKAKKK